MKLLLGLKFRFYILLISALVTNIGFAEELIQVGCKIFDMNGRQVFSQSTGDCIFLDNGNILNVLDHQVVMLDKSNGQLWSNQGAFHHQEKINYDKNRVYLLSAKVHPLAGEMARFDIIQVYNLKNGKLIAELDFQKYLPKFIVENGFKFTRGDFQTNQLSYNFETTHINSLYEIPPNPLEKKNTAFKRGNWLVNVSFLQFFAIFDKDFKKLIWKQSYIKNATSVHDAKFLSNGKIAFYANDMKKGSELYSTILYIDPMKSAPSNLVEEFIPQIERRNMYQSYLGGFDLAANGDKLISIYTEKLGFQIGVYDSKMQLKFRFAPNKNLITGKGLPFQEPRFLNNSFLKNHQGDL